MKWASRPKTDVKQPKRRQAAGINNWQVAKYSASEHSFFTRVAALEWQ